MTTIKVYPVPGRVARHPETGEPVPAAGLSVPRSPYWLRRLLDGDVSVCAGKAVPDKTKEGK